MDYAGFLRATDKGQIPPVVLLHGPEPLLLDDAVFRVTRALFPDPSSLALSREVLEARDAGAEGIVQSALVLPWIGARRLVVAKGADALGANQSEPLVAYLGSPNPSTVLLMLVDQSLPSSHWLMRAMPPGAVVPVVPLAGRQLVAWLCARVQEDGFELTEQAATLLVELSGDDLAQLTGEVEKAALAGGPDNRRVGVAEVKAVVGEHRLHRVFELARAVNQRDGGAALTLLEALLNGGEEPLAVLGMLGREMRSVWQAAEGLRLGRAEDEIARGLGRPPGASAAVMARARALRPERAAWHIRRCWDTERRLKLGGLPRPELSLLIVDLCAG